MRKMLQDQLGMLRGYPGDRKYATEVEYLGSSPFHTQRILERDYFPADAQEVIGDQVIVTFDQSEPQIDAALPEIRVVESGAEGGEDQVTVADPQSEEEPIIITFPSETDTT